jgi:hypothetical protein
MRPALGLLALLAAKLQGGAGRAILSHPQESHRPHVAVCVCSKPVGPHAQSAIATLLAPSLGRTISAAERAHFAVSFYVGVDDTDAEFAAWLRTHLRLILPRWIALRVLTFPRTGRIPFNEITRAAYGDNATYIARLNDDTEFVTHSWITAGTQALHRFDPRNVGVAGPTCNEGNTDIMTHDMVHRVHLDIFDDYYPPQFYNWWVDDWISRVYGRARTLKLETWRVVHHISYHGTRYSVDFKQAQALESLVAAGADRIARWVDRRHKQTMVRRISVRSAF